MDEGAIRRLDELAAQVENLRRDLAERMRRTEARVSELETHRDHDMRTVEDVEDRLDAMHRAAWVVVLELATGLIAWGWVTLFGGGLG